MPDLTETPARRAVAAIARLAPNADPLAVVLAVLMDVARDTDPNADIAVYEAIDADGDAWSISVDLVD